jgi:hypothetical protein
MIEGRPFGVNGEVLMSSLVAATVGGRFLGLFLGSVFVLLGLANVVMGLRGRAGPLRWRKNSPPMTPTGSFFGGAAGVWGGIAFLYAVAHEYETLDFLILVSVGSVPLGLIGVVHDIIRSRGSHRRFDGSEGPPDEAA